MEFDNNKIQKIRQIFSDELAKFEGQDGISLLTVSVMSCFPDYYLSDKNLIEDVKFALDVVESYFDESMYPSDRNIIKSAIMLSDGYKYGVTKRLKGAIDGHGSLAAELIRAVAFSDIIPPFIQHDIAGIVEKHDSKTDEGMNKSERLVWQSLKLANDRKKFGKFFSNSEEESAKSEFQTSVRFARDLTKKNVWDGYVYVDENNENVIIINDNRLNIPPSLADAFFTISNSMRGKTENEAKRDGYVYDPSLQMWVSQPVELKEVPDGLER